MFSKGKKKRIMSFLASPSDPGKPPEHSTEPSSRNPRPSSPRRVFWHRIWGQLRIGSDRLGTYLTIANRDELTDRGNAVDEEESDGGSRNFTIKSLSDQVAARGEQDLLTKDCGVARQW